MRVFASAANTVVHATRRVTLRVRATRHGRPGGPYRPRAASRIPGYLRESPRFARGWLDESDGAAIVPPQNSGRAYSAFRKSIHSRTRSGRCLAAGTRRRCRWAARRIRPAAAPAGRRRSRPRPPRCCARRCRGRPGTSRAAPGRRSSRAGRSGLQVDHLVLAVAVGHAKGPAARLRCVARQASGRRSGASSAGCARRAGALQEAGRGDAQAPVVGQAHADQRRIGQVAHAHRAVEALAAPCRPRGRSG